MLLNSGLGETLYKNYSETSNLEAFQSRLDKCELVIDFHSMDLTLKEMVQLSLFRQRNASPPRSKNIFPAPLYL